MTEEDELIVEELMNRLGEAGEVSAEIPINTALTYLHTATRLDEHVAKAICAAMTHIIRETVAYYEAIEQAAEAVKH